MSDRSGCGVAAESTEIGPDRGFGAGDADESVGLCPLAHAVGVRRPEGLDDEPSSFEVLCAVVGAVM